MSLRINDTAPDFTAETSEGTIKFHDWIGDSYAMLFSHPKDFTPVCATELAAVAKLKGEFDKRNTKVIGLSVDKVEDHKKWAEDIKDIAGGVPLNYPLIADGDLEVAKLYDMLPAEEQPGPDRTPATNQTVRSVFLIGPDKKIKMSLTYPMASGRNFQELLRVIDSVQLTSKGKVSTPADWKKGEDIIISGAVNNDEAKQLWPQGWETVKPYLRKAADPSK